MQEVLLKKLHNYISEHHPDLLFKLQQEQQVTNYLKTKVSAIDSLLEELTADNLPPYIIEERCMEILTSDLRPSKYDYIQNILLEDFQKDYERLQQSGILTTEVINMIQACDPVFEDLNFSEDNQENRFLRYAIIGTIKEYFEGKGSEMKSVRHGL